MSHNIVAYYSVFNENNELFKKSINSIISYVDKIIVVDGRYKGYPAKNPISNDGTRDFVRSLGNKVELYDAPNLEEWQKWDLMFKYAPKGSWILMLGADNALTSPEDLHNISKCQTPLVRVNVQENWWVRLFRNDGKTHFAGAHYAIKRGKKLISIVKTEDLDEVETLTGNFRIDNLDYKRDENRKKEKEIYFEKLNEMEEETYAKLQRASWLTAGKR
jgi:hypothetical protein